MTGVDVLDGGGVENQALPLAAEQLAFLVQAEIVPNSSDVEQGNNGTASHSAVVKLVAMDESEPNDPNNDPNLWDLFKVKSEIHGGCHSL
jgi:hypothetical protein